MRRERRIQSGRLDGQSLVELAIVAPILITLLVITLDLGRIFAAWIAVTNSAREGAYYASRSASGSVPDASIRSAAAGEGSGALIVADAAHVAIAYPSPDLIAVTVRSAFDPVAPLTGALWGGSPPWVSAKAVFPVMLATPTSLPITPSTPIPSSTPTPSPTNTFTPTPTPTNTSTATASVTRSATPSTTNTAIPATATPTFTVTPLPTGTFTPAPTATSTATRTLTATWTPAPTSTGTVTPAPTGTATPPPSSTPIPTATQTRTGTPIPQIALVQKNTAVSGSASVSATFSANPIQGDLLVAIVGTGTGNPTLSVAGWNLAVSSIGQPVQAIFYKTAGASESRTVTATRSSGNTLAIAVFEYSAVATSSPLDQTATGTDGVSISRNGGSFTCGSVTTLQTRELLIAGFSISADPTVNVSNSWSGSFTEEVEQGDSGNQVILAAADRIVSATGTYQTGSTLLNGSGSGSARCQMATFKSSF